MKNLFFTVLVIVQLACTKDKNVPTPKPSIVGDWQLNSENYVDCVDPNNNHLEGPLCSEAKCWKYTFTENGLVFFIETSNGIITGNESLEYSISGTTLIYCGSTSCSAPKEFELTSNELNITTVSPYWASDCTVVESFSRIP
jgi:hypothetical protein